MFARRESELLIKPYKKAKKHQNPTMKCIIFARGESKLLFEKIFRFGL